MSADSGLTLARLSAGHDLSSFDCGDGELDDFLRSDALEYQEQYLANTTVMLLDHHIAGYFSLAADAIRLNATEKDDGEIHARLSHFPAIKIARLAVHAEFQRSGYGSLAVEYCVGPARHLNDEHRHDGIACRFVTVDAYPNAVDWYQRFGFVKNQARRSKKRQTVSLRLDALPIKD